MEERKALDDVYIEVQFQVQELEKNSKGKLKSFDSLMLIAPVVLLVV